MAPSKVQHREDGPWYPWTNGNVGRDQLIVAQQMAAPSYINGCLTYGLKMDENTEWNVKKGWIKK